MRSTKKKKKKKNPMGLGRKIILVLCIIVFVGSAGVLLDYVINGMREESALNDLANMKMSGEELVTDKGTVVAEYSKLYQANNDIIGWIKINGTKVDYPVMQTQDDPEYYIRRGFDKESTSSGTPFMDAAVIFHTDVQFHDIRDNMKNGACSMYLEIESKVSIKT